MKDFKRIVRDFNIFESREYIRQIDAAIIMISLSFGTAVVILPYSINQLGIVGFVLTLWMAILILLYSSVTVTASCSMLNTEKCDYEALRDPFPFLAELAYGKIFRKILVAVMYICNISMAISFLLVSATILSDLVKVDIMSRVNDIRITVLISIILASPLMYIGLYKDLVSTAYMAVVTSVIAMAFIFGDSISAHKFYNNGAFYYSDYLTNISSDTMFSQYGVLIFALSGPVFVLPNVFVYVEKKDQLQKTVIFTHIVIYFLYILCAFVPYLLFQGQVLPSITESISNVAKYHKVSIMFRLIVITVQLLVSCHLILVSVLIMNPIYQMFESYIDIPQGKMKIKDLSQFIFLFGLV